MRVRKLSLSLRTHSSIRYCSILLRLEGRLSGALVQQVPAVPRTLEVEQVLQRSRAAVKRSLDALSANPVVLDEPEDGALVRQGVINEVALRIRRDQQQR